MSPNASLSLSPSDSSVLARTRRSKGKSRFGCLRCKASRVKCDEIHPTCTKCKNVSATCVYAVTKAPKWKGSTGTLVFSDPKKECPTLASVEVAEYMPGNIFSTMESQKLPRQLTHVPLENGQSFDTQEVFLLNHFTSITSGGLWGSQRTWSGDGVQLAFQNPFLMHAIVALAARHLHTEFTSTTGYSDSRYKQLEATHYQKALSIYSAEFKDRLLENHDAILAASFIFVYYSCSLKDFKPSSTTPSDDSSITFIRGIRAIVHSVRFRETPGPMDTLLYKTPGFGPQEAEYGPGKRLLNLIERMYTTSKHPLSFMQNKNVYIDRVHSLAPYFEICTMQSFDCPFTAELVLRFLRWQALCPPEFVELIRIYDKVALSIMAHYYAAAACHLVRVKNVWWWWRDKPAYMVQTILDFLHSDEWEEWNEWPRAMLQRATSYREP